MAVSLYIVLSGFVTHLAYRSKSFATCTDTYKFYLRRFGRIWLTYYFSCVLGVSRQVLFHELLPLKDYVLPLLLLDAWNPTAREELPHPTSHQCFCKSLPPQAPMLTMHFYTHRHERDLPQPQPGRLDAEHAHPSVGGVSGP